MGPQKIAPTISRRGRIALAAAGRLSNFFKLNANAPVQGYRYPADPPAHASDRAGPRYTGPALSRDISPALWGWNFSPRIRFSAP